jgi:hypothetical protein
MTNKHRRILFEEFISSFAVMADNSEVGFASSLHNITD